MTASLSQLFMSCIITALRVCKILSLTILCVHLSNFFIVQLMYFKKSNEILMFEVQLVNVAGFGYVIKLSNFLVPILQFFNNLQTLFSCYINLQSLE